MLGRDYFPKIEDLGRTTEEISAEIDALNEKLNTKLPFMEKTKIRKQLNKDYMLLEKLTKR